MKKSAKARIIAFGLYLPEKVLSNQELEGMVETSDEWIISRTGIKSDVSPPRMKQLPIWGIVAAKRALHQAGMAAHDIELILVATLTPNHYL